MTLRVSFPKLIIETLRRHLAAVLITLLAFFVHLISFFLNVQNILNTKVVEDMLDSHYPATRGTEYVVEQLTELCSPNMWSAVLAMLIGVYLAFDFFRYLHSKKETDFYESMPIRKQTWFLTLLTVCVGIFSILATVTVLLELAIVYSVGYGSSIIVQNMLWCLLCMIGVFLAAYATTVLAMIMTGHTIIAFLGFGVFASYIPLIISNLIPLYSNVFFDTYVYRDLNPIYYYFSPVTLAYKASYSYSYNGNVWNIDEHWTYLLGCFVFALVLGIVAYFLFLRRPAETAGRAMAFEKINPVIRILLVIPIALYAGLLLNEIAAYASFAWLIFGVIFVAFLIHGIIECIFQFDIKALITKKRQLLFTILFSLAFVFVFWADVFQYDKYMPKEENVKTVYIDTYLFDDNPSDWEQYKDGLSGDSVRLALEAIEDIRFSSNPLDDMEYTYMNDFTITYLLKNGAKRERRYSYYGNKFPESLNQLTATEDFKNDYNILYHYENADITSISASNGMEQFTLPITKEQQKELCDIYLKEYNKITISEMLSEQAIYQIFVEYLQPGGDKNYTCTDCYKVFADFKETISYLEKLGVTSFANSEMVKLENLELHSKYEDEAIPKYVGDKSQLNALKPYMILGDFMHYRLDYANDYASCTLRYRLDNETRYTDVYLKTSDIIDVLGK